MQLVQIGTSKGIRIPKKFIEKYGLDRGIKIVEEEGGLRLIPEKNKPRQGWEQFYKKHAASLDIDQDFIEMDIDNDIE